MCGLPHGLYLFIKTNIWRGQIRAALQGLAAFRCGALFSALAGRAVAVAAVHALNLVQSLIIKVGQIAQSANPLLNAGPFVIDQDAAHRLHFRHSGATSAVPKRGKSCLSQPQG